MEKPNNVPADAWFHEEWQEWILGKKDGDKCVGEWKQWHKKEGHLTCIEIFDDNGNTVHETRFHADGTYSQKVPYVNGVQHGTAYYQGSKNPTTERVLEQSPSPNIFRFEFDWNEGQVVATRQWDVNDNELGQNGSLLNPIKPSNVDEKASWNAQNQEWELTSYDSMRRPNNSHKYWRADGSLFEEIVFKNGIKNINRQYHPSGNLAWEIKYQDNCLLMKNRIMIDEENTDIDFPRGNLSSDVMKKEYVFDTHGFMSSWKAWNKDGNLIKEETLNLSMDGAVNQISFNSLEEASKTWNDKVHTYYKDLNYFVDQFHIENHPEVEDIPEETMASMAKYIIQQIEKLNKEGRAAETRKLFTPSTEAFSQGFWNASGKEIQKVIALKDATLVTAANKSYKIVENQIQELNNVRFIGISNDKTKLVKCLDDKIEVEDLNNGNTLFTVEYPKDFGKEVMQQIPNINVEQLKPDNLEISDIVVSNDGSMIILTSLRGTFHIDKNSYKLIHPTNDLQNEYVDRYNSPEDFRFNLENFTALSADENLVVFSSKRSRVSGVVYELYKIEKHDNEIKYVPYKEDYILQGTNVPMKFHSNGKFLLTGYYDHDEETNVVLMENEHMHGEKQNLFDNYNKQVFMKSNYLCAITEYKDHFILGMSDKYVWLQNTAHNKSPYVYVGGAGNFGQVTSMDISPDQSKLYVGTDYGVLWTFSFLPEGKRGENIITNMNVKDEKRYLFLHSYEPMIW